MPHLLFALALTQALQAGPSRPPIERLFKKHQVDRYAVVIDTDGQAGNVHYEFNLTLTAIQAISETKDTKVSALFTNLKETADDREAPMRKKFGTALYRFPTSGFPMDVSMGEGSALVIPILSWYTPGMAVESGGDFQVGKLDFDDSIHVSGMGSYKELDKNVGTVTLNLVFAAPSTSRGFSQDGCTFEATTTFDLRSGVLLRSTGSEVRKDGATLKFQMRRL